MRATPIYAHCDFNVDCAFQRDNKYIQTVQDLDELKAKDLVCDLMHCVEELSDILNQKLDFEEVLEKYNFK